MLLLVGRAQAEKVLLVDGLETSQVSSMKADRIFLSVSRSGLAGGSSPAVTMGWGGCSTLSQPTNFGVLSLGCSFNTGGVFGASVEEEVVELFSSST